MSVPDTKFILIQNVRPSIDGGLHPVKRRVGERLMISAEVIKHGHDEIRAAVQFRKAGQRKWHEQPMSCVNAGLDLWETSISLDEIGMHEFAIVGWTDHYANWAKDTRKKLNVNDNVDSDLLAGIQFMEHCAERAAAAGNKGAAAHLHQLAAQAAQADNRDTKVHFLMNYDSIAAAAHWPDRDGYETGRSQAFKIHVDRKRAEFTAWYEVFPRSCGTEPGKSGTFQDVEKMLPYIAGMGFDTLYFTPIHPIGLSKRKGRNNSLTTVPGEPGSPYAVGNIHERHENGGGHLDVHHELGTLADFDHLVAACAEKGLEIALDIALNCSPDHPFLHSHPDWFYRRPDGSIKYAENPPKKYEDIYPLNFECADRANLWREICNMFLFWARRGVRAFRVDNPHTKPIVFWQWCIAEVHKEFPDVVFLSEAFTRPRLLESLAKIGFSQSYGYFTWRESKAELTEYFEYLNQSEAAEYLICNVFPTTPDILPKHLQHASLEMFKIRFTLAALLSPCYGFYTGYEHGENIPVGPRDELMDSEKYEFKVRDYSNPPLTPYVALINQIRRDNRALQQTRNLRFHEINNERILFFSKQVQGNTLLIFINLDPSSKQAGLCRVPMRELGLSTGHSYKLHDLLTDKVYEWQGEHNFVELRPDEQCAHVFRVF